jgi:hypothetical protein
MKTILEIPDAIFRRAKTVAAEREIPFSSARLGGAVGQATRPRR